MTDREFQRAAALVRAYLAHLATVRHTGFKSSDTPR